MSPEEWHGFLTTLEAICAKHPNGWLNGAKIFQLHDTFGLPFSFIREACRDRDVHFDESGIRAELRCAYDWSAERIEAELRA